ncbi:helix-turn-helix domain-containing protein [Pendulispora brunnea]|uniref:helix-turn-helix domain-containing protein n=1 Tax=Pendulispora brunnea TaxID=2905690 RepID=UPI00374E19BD
MANVVEGVPNDESKDRVRRKVGEGEKIAALCREFGVSRQAGDKWIKRFKESGYDDLEEQSRRRRRCHSRPQRTLLSPCSKHEIVIQRWGPRKLEPMLRRRFGEQTPSERSIARILKRANKVRERRRQRLTSIVERAPRMQAKHPNDVWTVDFKGWWGGSHSMVNGTNRSPYVDAYSRFVLDVVVCRPAHEAVKGVRAALSEVRRAQRDSV